MTFIRSKMKTDVAELSSGKCYAVEGAGEYGWCKVYCSHRLRKGIHTAVID